MFRDLIESVHGLLFPLCSPFGWSHGETANFVSRIASKLISEKKELARFRGRPTAVIATYAKEGFVAEPNLVSLSLSLFCAKAVRMLSK